MGEGQFGAHCSSSKCGSSGYSSHTTAQSVREAEAMYIHEKAYPFSSPLQQSLVEVAGCLKQHSSAYSHCWQEDNNCEIMNLPLCSIHPGRAQQRQLRSLNNTVGPAAISNKDTVLGTCKTSSPPTTTFPPVQWWCLVSKANWSQSGYLSSQQV